MYEKRNPKKWKKEFKCDNEKKKEIQKSESNDCKKRHLLKKRAAIFLQAFIVMFHFFGTKRIFSSNQNKEKKNSKKEDLKW